MKISLFDLKKTIPEGEFCPRGYGVAYKSLHQMAYICYPIPLNQIVRVWRNFYFWLAFPMRSFRDDVEKNFYDVGYERGYRMGWDAQKIDSRKHINELLTAIVMGATERKDEAERN